MIEQSSDTRAIVAELYAVVCELREIKELLWQLVHQPPAT